MEGSLEDKKVLCRALPGSKCALVDVEEVVAGFPFPKVCVDDRIENLIHGVLECDVSVLRRVLAGSKRCSGRVFRDRDFDVQFHTRRNDPGSDEGIVPYTQGCCKVFVSPLIVSDGDGG